MMIIKIAGLLLIVGHLQSSDLSKFTNLQVELRSSGSLARVAAFLTDNPVYQDNLVYLEAILISRGATWVDMVNQDLQHKKDILAIILAAPGASLVVDSGSLATRRGKELGGHFEAAVGLGWGDARTSRGKNGVGLREAPHLNKYNEGNFSVNLITLESLYASFKSKVPDKIQTVLSDISESGIKLYIEIDSELGWNDKGRRMNLIFHGTMIDWYKGEKSGDFDFNSVFVKDLPMGIFDLNGIKSVDLAVDSLKALNVNAHNQLYSPDNAGFVISPGRQIVTFWSVAKDIDKQRAVVTFHILFDWELQNGFKGAVLDLSRHSPTLGDLLTGLGGLNNLIGNSDDKDAWVAAISYLQRLYS